MKLKCTISILLYFVLTNIALAQEYTFNPNIDKDSLYQEVVKSIPEERQAEFIKMYEEQTEEFKELLLIMLSQPVSSKKELVENYNAKTQEIAHLTEEYARLVPDTFIVYVEFNPANRIIQTPKTIDLHIYNRATKKSKQEWTLEYDSDTLAAMLLTLGWKFEDLLYIKRLLDEANCISIKNANPFDVGFARSGMGKYSYRIFEENLSLEEQKEYTDDCMYIFYKDNVVLEYGGGAVGSVCFPDFELNEEN